MLRVTAPLSARLQRQSSHQSHVQGLSEHTHTEFIKNRGVIRDPSDNSCTPRHTNTYNRTNQCDEKRRAVSRSTEDIKVPEPQLHLTHFGHRSVRETKSELLLYPMQLRRINIWMKVSRDLKNSSSTAAEQTRIRTKTPLQDQTVIRLPS